MSKEVADLLMQLALMGIVTYFARDATKNRSKKLNFQELRNQLFNKIAPPPTDPLPPPNGNGNGNGNGLSTRALITAFETSEETRRLQYHRLDERITEENSETLEIVSRLSKEFKKMQVENEANRASTARQFNEVRDNYAQINTRLDTIMVMLQPPPPPPPGKVVIPLDTPNADDVPGEENVA